MFLSGQYEHQVDQKGRMRLPSRFKELLGKNVFIMKGNRDCLYIVDEEEANKISEKIGQLSRYDEKQADMARYLTQGTVIEEDNQGRFLLPQYLRTFASLEKDIVFVGVGNRVELWSAERWEKKNLDLQNKSKEMNEDLSKLGI